ncbi:hypothetical protein EVAR_92766_1 [Eumeta japonica]|uniref:Uncharacterized protein n=1 Tax=Eumeta variegata TaxID=151549 RepID=A0A4C1SY58_EUMVA|nr:hypothetical protein EVAR_92766_1 [Eumeta japonica]
MEICSIGYLLEEFIPETKQQTSSSGISEEALSKILENFTEMKKDMSKPQNIKNLSENSIAQQNPYLLQARRKELRSKKVKEHEKKCQAVEFQPLAIPVTEWRPQEPASAPAPVPARYWEDALRHSVYLTLVRDKIDELIAHGDDGPPDPGRYDLWDKIKDASFQRLAIKEPATQDDVTLMARGRLFEDKEKFQFVEDETRGKICNNPSCMDGVRALWSVKRTRQRDQDPGNYRYELTFSVITRINDGFNNKYSSPARTFTVREMNPETRIESFTLDGPLQFVESKDSSKMHDGRAVWFHRNINPLQRQQGRHLQLYNTDRIFSSFLINNEPDVWKPPTQKYSKIGYMGLSSGQQRKVIPYNYTPYKTMNLVQYGRPPTQSATFYSQHQQLEKDIVAVSHPPQITNQRDKSLSQSNPTRTPFLPTPLSTTLIVDKVPLNKNIIKKLQHSTNITRTPEVAPVYVKSKQPMMSLNYVAERIRPPVYNTPPGVFAIMDKKPFKPMPPIKIQSYAKTKKPSKPLDFRPSPQVIDLEFSELDSLSESAFKPVNPFANVSSKDIKETNDTLNSTLENNFQYTRKTSELNELQEKVDARKQQNNTNIFTTTTDTIEQDLQSEKALEAFTKTTPMESEKETIQVTTTFATTTIKEMPLTPQNNSIITSRTSVTPHTTSTTPVFKHRQLRPQTRLKNKIIKTPSTTIATERTSANKPFSEIDFLSTHTVMGVAITGTTIDPTTEMTSTTTTTSTNPTTPETSSTTETVHTTFHKTAKVSNRYRQSTLMKKGTSAKQDKKDNSENKFVIKTVIAPMSQYPPRRNGSNFQGHSAVITEDSRVVGSTDSYVTTTEQSILKQAPATPYSNSERSGNNLKMNSDSVLYPETTNNIRNNDSTVSENNHLMSNTNQQVRSNITTTPLPHLNSKNKTKCKKRKYNNILNEDIHETTSELMSPITESTTTIDIYDLSYTNMTTTNISSHETTTVKDYDYMEEASINKKHNIFDSIDLGNDEDIYHNIHHKADYENNSEEHSTQVEYEDEDQRDTSNSESGEGQYEDSQEKDTTYDIFQLLFNETNQQLQFFV